MRNSSVFNSMSTSMFSLDWQKRSIESLCQRITSGGTPSRQNPDFYKAGTIRWIKTKELKDWYIDDSEEKITTEALNNSSAKLFPASTILMAMYGDGRTITSLGILRKESASNQACCAMIVNPEICNYLFLFYSLKFHRNDFIHLASGASQRNLNAQTIRNFEIKVPELHIQNKIAKILSAYDDLIENNTRRIKILEEMAQLLYREWFVNFRFPGHQDVPLVESELGLIPQGWKLKKLGDVIELAYGKALKADDRKGGEVAVYGSSGVVGYHNQYLVKAPGIIVGRKGNVGSIFWSDVDFFPIDTVYYVQTRVSLPYVYYNLQTQNFINNDAAVPGLNRNQAYSLPFLLPTQDVLQKFEGFVLPVFQQLRNLSVKNENLRTTRDLLLPKLISGEIDIEIVESYREDSSKIIAA